MANIITIIRGDSTDYEGDPILIININTENDLTGYKGKFQVGSITKEYENVTSKSVNVVLDKIGNSDILLEISAKIRGNLVALTALHSLAVLSWMFLSDFSRSESADFLA